MNTIPQKNVEELTTAYKEAIAYAQKLEKELAEYKQVEANVIAENVRLSEKVQQAEALQQTICNRLDLPIDEATFNLTKIDKALQKYITEQEGGGTELKAHANQRAILAEFGQSVLAGVDLPILMESLVNLVAETLQVEYCQVLELLPKEDALLLRAGTGWREELVGETVISTDPNSQIGYTLLSSEPVVVEDLRTETRFSGPSYLYDYAVVSSICVIIDGKDWPFGVLGTYSTKARKFTSYDITFLQSIANMLAQAIERARAEEALRESEEMYRTLIEQSGESIFLIYGGRFEVINPKFEELFGVTQEEANTPGFVFTNIIAPKSKGIINQISGDDEENKLRPRYEFTALDRNGREIEVELTVFYPTYKGGLATQGIIRDITERKQAEEEKRRAYEQIQEYTVELAAKIEEEQRQREIATILADVVASVSLTLSTDELLNHILLKLQQLILCDSAVIFLNKGDYLIAEAARGFETDLINQQFSFEEDRLFQEMQTQKGYILIRDTRQDDRYKFWLGAEKVRSWIGAPLLVAQEVIGYLTIDRYVPGAFGSNDANLVQAFAHQVAQAISNAQLYTELRETQTQLVERERLAALGQMAATVAHDLRNPLMAIRMGVEYFIQDLPEGDSRQQGAALMQTNISRIDGIVENILYIARVPKPDLTPNSLYSVITKELTRWELDLDKKKLTSRTALARNLPLLLLDFDQMGRALSNLISNSVDAMESGGELRLTLNSENGNQIITIADNGSGILPEHRSKIFEPFFTTKLRGTGLGLAIVKQIIEYHRGSITVWSKGGVGTKFTITLPQPEDLNSGDINDR